MEQRNDSSGRIRPIRRTFNTENNDNVLNEPSTCARLSSIGSSPMEYVLKIKYLADTRRKKVEWPRQSVSTDVYTHILNAVKECFDDFPTSISCQYVDAEGDACTLVPSTVEDCLSFARNGVLRLIVSNVPSPAHAPIAVTPSAADSRSWSMCTPLATPRASEGAAEVELSIEDQYELIEWS